MLLVYKKINSFLLIQPNEGKIKFAIFSQLQEFIKPKFLLTKFFFPLPVGQSLGETKGRRLLIGIRLIRVLLYFGFLLLTVVFLENNGYTLSEDAFSFKPGPDPMKKFKLEILF